MQQTMVTTRFFVLGSIHDGNWGYVTELSYWRPLGRDLGWPDPRLRQVRHSSQVRHSGEEDLPKNALLRLEDDP